MSISINSSGLQLDQLGSQIKASIRAAEHSEGKALNHFKAAGLYLQEAKRRVEAGEYEGKNFSHYCSRYAQISASRAYELVAIADGTTTIEEVRSRAAEGMKVVRANRAAESEELIRRERELVQGWADLRAQSQSFRNITDKPQPTDSAQKKVSKPINLGGRPPVDQLAHLRTLISKQAKLMQTKEQLVQALELITKLNN